MELADYPFIQFGAKDFIVTNKRDILKLLSTLLAIPLFGLGPSQASAKTVKKKTKKKTTKNKGEKENNHAKGEEEKYREEAYQGFRARNIGTHGSWFSHRRNSA